MGTTKKPVIPAGRQLRMTNHVFAVGTKANMISEITTPVPNNIKSKGRKRFNINVPFLALAGTKYPFI